MNYKKLVCRSSLISDTSSVLEIRTCRELQCYGRDAEYYCTDYIRQYYNHTLHTTVALVYVVLMGHMMMAGLASSKGTRLED